MALKRASCDAALRRGGQPAEVDLKTAADWISGWPPPKSDRSAQKRRALARLEALVRRALTEGWTCVRWRAQIAKLAAERRGKRRNAVLDAGEDAVAAPPESLPSEAMANLLNARTAAPATGDGSLGEASQVASTLPEILRVLEDVIGSAGSAELEGAVSRLHGVLARISEAVEPAVLFTCEGGQFVVFLDRLKRRPVDPYQRSALIKQAESVLSAARRAVET